MQITNYKMYTGEIFLRRKKSNFRAGFCVINKSLSNLIEASSMLHQDEMKYYETLKYDKRKTSYLLGRISAKKAVSEVLQKEVALNSFSIEPGVFQFPVVKHLKSQNTQVTISHCNTIGIGLAFPEEHPLGVDIEKIDKGRINVMKSIVSNEEFNKIYSYSLTELIGTTLVWSIKEALSKILKTGLTTDFKIFEIKTLQKQGSEYISTFKYFTQYKVVSHQVGDYMCSIVLPKNTSCNLIHFWNALINIEKESTKVNL